MVISRKYSAPAIQSFSPQELMAHTKGLILKIQIITGWQLPEVELMPILFDQFSKKLIESYQTFNINEVEYAFRMNGGTIKDWGKFFNLSLFDEVMVSYQHHRLEASKQEEAARLKEDHDKNAPEVAPKLTNVEKIETARGLWDTLKKVDFIYPGAFQALIEEGLMKYPTIEEQKMYLAEAEIRVTQHGREDRNFFNGKDREEWKKIYARKLVVADYFLGKR